MLRADSRDGEERRSSLLMERVFPVTVNMALGRMLCVTFLECNIGFFIYLVFL